MKNFKSIAVLFLFMTLISNKLVSYDKFDQWMENYNDLLSKYVVKSTKSDITMNLVDYIGMRNDPSFEKLDTEIAKLNSVNSLPKEKQLAFWINAYNFLTFVKIVRNPKIKTIKNLNSFLYNVWEQDAGIIDGKMRSLDEIEKEIIKKFNEPMTHFALNCASIGCPDIRNESYYPEKLKEQLEDQLKEFLNNEKKGMKIDQKNKILYLSKFFYGIKKISAKM